MPLTRDEILARKIGKNTDTVPVDDGEVVVRGLTRDEALRIRECESLAEKDNLLISLGMVDPAMTLDDVAAWAAADDAGTLAAVSERIGQLSGMVEGAGKSGVPSTRRRR